MKVAFVSYADGLYVEVQRPLITSLLKHTNAHIFTFRNVKDIHPDCPTHQENPYAFKVYAIEYARKFGFDIVIWLDSPNRLKKATEPWLEDIARVGVYLQADGWWCGEWANDRCLDYFGVSRDEAMKIQNIYACIMAFDFRHPIADQFFTMWKQACLDGIFRGKHHNKDKTESQDERCQGHRHDQSCAELIAHKLGIPLSPLVLDQNGYFSSWI